MSLWGLPWNHLMVCYLHLSFLFYPRWKTLKFGTYNMEATFIASCSFLWELIFIVNLSEFRILWEIISGYVRETVYKLVRTPTPCIVSGIIVWSVFPTMNKKEKMSWTQASVSASCLRRQWHKLFHASPWFPYHSRLHSWAWTWVALVMYLSQPEKND